METTEKPNTMKPFSFYFTKITFNKKYVGINTSQTDSQSEYKTVYTCLALSYTCRITKDY